MYNKEKKNKSINKGISNSILQYKQHTYWMYEIQDPNNVKTSKH